MNEDIADKKREFRLITKGLEVNFSISLGRPLTEQEAELIVTSLDHTMQVAQKEANK